MKEDLFEKECANSGIPEYQTPKNGWDFAWKAIHSKKLLPILILLGVAHLNYIAMFPEKKDDVKDFLMKSFYRMKLEDMLLKTDDKMQPLNEVFDEHKIEYDREEPYAYGSESDKVDELVGILRTIEASRMRPSPAHTPKKLNVKPRARPKAKAKNLRPLRDYDPADTYEEIISPEEITRRYDEDQEFKRERERARRFGK